jgi:hypothetical protein
LADTTNPGAGESGPSGSRRPLTIDLPSGDYDRLGAAGEAEPTRVPDEDGMASSIEAEAVPAPDPDEVSVDALLDSDVPNSDAAVAAAASPTEQDRSEPMPRQHGRGFGALLLAALLGGLIAAGGFVLLGRSGALEGLFAQQAAAPATAPEVSAAIASLQNDVAGLQQQQADRSSNAAQFQGDVAGLRQQVNDLGKRLAAPSANPAVEALERRVGALEAAKPAGGSTDIAGLTSRLTQLARDVDTLKTARGTDPTPALGALRTQIADLSARLAKAEQRPSLDPAALTAAIAPLQQKVADLTTAEQTLPALQTSVGQLKARLDAAPTEARVATLEASLKQIARQAELAQALGPAVVADALTNALASGAPFKAELDALGGFGVDPAAARDLQAKAETGVPTLYALRSMFDEETSAMDLRPQISADAGPMERLLQSARGLVAVRSAGAAPGDEPSVVVGRIKAALRAGDLVAALADWEKLPDAAKAQTAGWREAAAARRAAESLAARLRAAALARLGTQG